MTTIEFVNHASYIAAHGRVRLICDPWLEGPVFDYGWDLLAETRFAYDDFRNITHIWFSHEHPDHFNPPNLNKIAPEARAGITVLFQETKDRKVVNYCRKLGFRNVIEMRSGNWLRLDDEMEVLCEPHDNGDSWLATRTPQGCILNINDCVINSEKECKKILGKTGPIVLLATQFSYAQWVANKGDTAAIAAAARQKLEWVRVQTLALRPKYLLPFASFSYFSHADNFYLNLGINKLDVAVEFIREETSAQPVLMYPGDRWEMGSSPLPDCASAINRYSKDYERAMKKGILHEAKQVPLDDLLKHARDFGRELRSKNAAWAALLPSVAVFVEDHQQAIVFSTRGAHLSFRDREHCDIACKSGALDYCFVCAWGGRTLDINGCFQVPKEGRYAKFKMYATVAGFNNRSEGLRSILSTVCQRGRKQLRPLVSNFISERTTEVGSKPVNTKLKRVAPD